MPTYEYHCDNCNSNFDIVQSFHDDALTECVTCSSPVRKVFGNVGIVFKGSGFYKTDSRSNGSAKAAVGDATAKSEGSEGSGSGSEGSGSGSGAGTESSGSGTDSGSSSTGEGSSASAAPASPSAPSTPSTAPAPASPSSGNHKTSSSKSGAPA